MSASCSSQWLYAATSNWRECCIERKSLVKIRTSSWASCAPSSWKAAKPGMNMSTRSKPAWHSAIRGSVSKVAVRGAGTGRSISQLSGARLAGSWAIRSCRIVVPVRGCPTMMIGRRISWAATAGWSLRQASIRSRLARSVTTPSSATPTPTSLSCAVSARDCR